ncbi:ATP-binding protein [Kineococcus gypseus]|uniref:ATP-binding protein n=1 Tax=Kineococcus gypseus TaxID=1637102 RepID=UPI003D7D3554
MTTSALDPGTGAGPLARPALRLQVLGPVRVWRDGTEVDTGPLQRTRLLALLLALSGRPVSTDDLIEMLWGDRPPPSALNVVHKYVGSLRRVMEPELPARASGSHLLRHGGGYLCRADADVLDLAVFRSLVGAARTAEAGGRPEDAVRLYVRALSQWRDRSGHGLTHEPAAAAVFAGLDEELHENSIRAADLAIGCDAALQVLPALRLAARTAPLHERVHASLIRSLTAAGQRAEALAVHARVRARLADELGVEPGDALRAAHQQALVQRTGRRQLATTRTVPAPPAEARSARAPHQEQVVGRREERTHLHHAARTLLHGGTTVTVIDGEPGAGKTHLLRWTGAEVTTRGGLVAWGRCQEGRGVPSLWPWTSVLQELTAAAPADALASPAAQGLAPLLVGAGAAVDGPVAPDASAQFRLFEQVRTLLAEVAAAGPVLLVVDDLQWADTASLRLLEHLVARAPRGVGVLAALRDRDPVPGSELARTLAVLARAPGHRRMHLGPLTPGEVAQLVREETGVAIGSGAALDVHDRTGGNPFFVRELARLGVEPTTAPGAAGVQDAVPGSVRDVVASRVAKLEESAARLLRTAALIGRDGELQLLAAVCGLGLDTCLATLEPITALGLLELEGCSGSSVRFAHDLVRESVLHAVPAHETGPLHLRIADALEQLGGDDAVLERVAHHLWSAGAFAEPRRVATALLRAGRLAVLRTALEAAERWFRLAVQAARAAGAAPLELSALGELVAVTGMRSMYGLDSLDLLQRAQHLARELGREEEATMFTFSRWTAHSQALDTGRSTPIARALHQRAQASSSRLVRAYGLQAWGLQQYSDGDVGAAHTDLLASSHLLAGATSGASGDPVAQDLQLHALAMLAEVSAVHGDEERARTLLDELELRADAQPFATTVWAMHTVRTAAMAGRPQRALQGALRGVQADPDASYVFHAPQVRLGLCWARALTGQDPAQALARAAELIDTHLTRPVRSCAALWLGLHAEMAIAAGELGTAAASLGRAHECLERYGQRYPEGLLLMIDASLMRARGEDGDAVQQQVAAARELSLRRGAPLFARRRDPLLP